MNTAIPTLLLVLTGFASSDTSPLDPAQFIDASGTTKRVVDEYRKGMSAFRDFLFRKDQSAVFQRGAKIREWAQLDRRKAQKAFEKCIKTDPDFREAYYYAALLELESGNPGMGIRALERMLARAPEDRTALFLIAVAHEAEGRIETARDYYTRALATIPPDQLEDWESIDLLDRQRRTGPFASYYADKWGFQGDLRQFGTSPPDALPTRSDFLVVAGQKSRNGAHEFWDRFWKRQDPLYLTDWNERRIAHYGRVAFADIRFGPGAPGNPGRGVGRETDRGRAWIKLGPYSKRSVHVGTVSANERWTYPNLNQDFADKTGDDNPDTWTFSEYLFEVKPTRYDDPYADRKFLLPHQVATFRDGDSIRVEMSYAVPRKRLKGKENYKITEGVFLFDADWDETRKQVDSVNVVWPEHLTRKKEKREGHLVGYQTFRVIPGEYSLVVEILDQSSGRIGTFRRKDLLKYGKKLALSDLLLASQILPQHEPVRSRQDLSIHPNPVRFYDRTAPLYVYLEIYNLARDVFGRTRYTLSYEVGKPEEHLDPTLFAAVDPAVREAVEREINEALRRTEDLERRITAEYEGEREEDMTYLAIDVGGLNPGIYKLTVEVEDQNTKERAQATAYFRVAE